MDTKSYRTKTIFKESDNAKLPAVWCVGLDIGYSSVKTFSGNSISCFPSYATKATGNSAISINGLTDETDIQYVDENNELWDVGAKAQDTIDVSDTSAGSLSIYDRDRYYSAMFMVIMRVGIAAGLRKNQFGDPSGKKLIIQTGLPPMYIKGDQQIMKDVMKGHHHFSVKFGSGQWEEFTFELTDDNILTMLDQPTGTLVSISTTKAMGLMPDAAKYFSSDIVIIDPGFGTLDIIPVRKGSVVRDKCRTNANFGMKAVFKATCDEIFEKYNYEISVPAIQKFLETGFVKQRQGRVYTKVPFADILERNSKKICDMAIDEILGMCSDCEYVVITGGTGAAWSNFIRNNENIKYNNTLQILSGNQGDPDIPYIFSNVRGYYIYAMSSLSA